MIKKRKSEILKKIYHCAELYKNKFSGKQFIFITEITNIKKINYYIINFQASNFCHLTGVITHLKPKDFYNKVRKKKLGLSDFQLDKQNYCEQKLAVLPYLLSMKEKSFTLVADHLNKNTHIIADKVIGNTHGCLICRSDGSSAMYPLSIKQLKNTRNDVTIRGTEEKIVCILSKDMHTMALFENLLYLSEEYSITYLKSKNNEIKKIIK